MRRRLELSGRLRLQDLDRLSRQLEALTAASAAAEIEVDLSRLQGITAAPLAMFLAALRHMHRQGNHRWLSAYAAPLAWPLSEQLSAHTLVEFFSDAAGCGIGIGRTPPGFGGYEPFTDGEGITRAAAALEASLRHQVSLEDSSLVTVAVMIADFAENVWQHASVDGGVATMQFDSGACRLELAVADCGIGIRESLRGNPDYEHLSDDVEAVRAATRAGVSGDPGSGGGLALYLTRLVVAENEGTLIIRSGEARLEQGPEVLEVACAPRFPGTLIAVSARSDRPLDYGLVDGLLKRPRGASEG